jgi:hypothetical protein
MLIQCDGFNSALHSGEINIIEAHARRIQHIFIQWRRRSEATAAAVGLFLLIYPDLARLPQETPEL